MVSQLLASVLQSYLGKYLQLTDTSISVGKEVRLENVRIRESAFADLGLPVRCVHGKVSKLVIKIPWFSLWRSSTTIEVEGVHLLIVPSSSVHYNEDKERQIELEAKQKRLQLAEDAKRKFAGLSSAATAQAADENADSLMEKFVANIVKNLEVSVSQVHIRYEDGQTNSSGYPFATGATLQSMFMKTKVDSDQVSQSSTQLNVFEKYVAINSFAIYWCPKASLYSGKNSSNMYEDTIDSMFDNSIGTCQVPIASLKYLIRPISSNATLTWCSSPERYDFKMPRASLRIQMQDLCLRLTKYQYHDFMMLLQAFEFMARAAKFRKYKARHKLENLHNYQGRIKELWKFAFDCVYEEEVMRRINNWSWSHMKTHLKNCKAYRELYKLKLTNASKLNQKQMSDLNYYEALLDEVNIRIQRQLAERDVRLDQAIERATSSSAASVSFWGWLSGKGGNDKSSSSTDVSSVKRLFEAEGLRETLSKDEKTDLYEAIGYQENAHKGNYPLSYVAYIVGFRLDQLTVDIRDEDARDAQVVKLLLQSVLCDITQRPSAANTKLTMSMASLTVTGFRSQSTEPPATIVTTRQGGEDDKLLTLCLENNPPSDEYGNLDEDRGSLYDQRIKLLSSPLEIMYDSATFQKLVSIFKTPDEINLVKLQQSAFAKLKEYRESTALSLQYVINNHNLVDVDILLMSSYIVLPHGGRFRENVACTVANLGSFCIRSKPISAKARSLKDMSPSDFTAAFKESLRDQAYDKFDVSLHNMQVLVALANENWRCEIGKRTSDMFLLKPTTIEVTFQICLIRNDPQLPLYKVNGKLDSICVRVADYRLLKLALILDSLMESSVPEEDRSKLTRCDSEESMASALSSVANTDSLIQGSSHTPASLIVIAPRTDPLDSDNPNQAPQVQLTQLQLNFDVDRVELDLSQLAKGSRSLEEEDIFHFSLSNLKTSAEVQTFETKGNFRMGSILCRHLLSKTPSGSIVNILETSSSHEDISLLSVQYHEVKKDSPDFESKYESTQRKLDVRFSSVSVTVHQDGIMDLVDKVNKLIDEVWSKAKNLAGMSQVLEQPRQPQPQIPAAQVDCSAKKRSSTTDSVGKKGPLSRKMSVRTSVNLSRWMIRSKLKAFKHKPECSDVVQLRINATLQSATFHFMTSQVSLATISVHYLMATYIQSDLFKQLNAKLAKFKVMDSSSSGHESLYKKIADNFEEQSEMLDATITLFDNDPIVKANNASVVDVQVEARLGRIRLVFLMKFLNDFLTFLEPFSRAKELVAERASDALEEAAKTMIDAYSNATRVQLQVEMQAPLIIVPVNSKSRTTFMADLGTLKLTNKFIKQSGNVFDEMLFTLRELKLMRVKIADSDSNDVLSQACIIHPITFDLTIRRNMHGSGKLDDPAEVTVTGTLHKIQAELSKGDYNVLMALLQENFSEKGSFESAPSSLTPARAVDRAVLNLPVKSRYSGSSTSLSSEGVRFVKAVINLPQRHPESKTVQFQFKFHGLQLQIFTGDTNLGQGFVPRDPALALAKFHIQFLSVEGHMKANSALVAEAYLENMVLEDSRFKDQFNSDRIVRLMEAKHSGEGGGNKMIQIDYKKMDGGDQNIEVIIYSFRLVGSVSYLLEIANFFIPDQRMSYEWSQENTAEVSDNPDAKMSVFVKIEEPDIFLVENIDDLNSDALMLNTEVQFKFWSVGTSSLSMMAALTDIRCHTCRFNPLHRRETTAQILQPCTLAFTVSKTEEGRIRVNTNISDLCLNVSPRSISIIRNCMEAFVNSMAKEEESLSSNLLPEEDHADLWKTRAIGENQFWFLKVDPSHEATEECVSSLSPATSIPSLDEQAIINVNNLVVKIESGVGNNTIPLLLLESKINCDVRNWSGSRMSIIGSVNLELAYYNAKLALWEPIIEPIVKDNVPELGGPSRKRWDMIFTIQKNCAHDLGSAFVSPSCDDNSPECFVSLEHVPPVMSICLQSRDVLEVTVTKSLVSVLETLHQTFSQVSELSKNDLPVSPFVIRNCLGKQITLLLDNKTFKFFVQGERPGLMDEYKLENDSEVNLVMFVDRTESSKTYVSPLQEQTYQAEASIRIRVSGERGTFDIPVCKADKRFFPFPYRGDELGDHHGLVCEIQVQNGCKNITFRSIIQIKNYYYAPMNIYFSPDSGANASQVLRLTRVMPDQVYNVPLQYVYCSPYEFLFQIDGPGENIGVETFCWRRLLEWSSSSVSQKVHFTNCQRRPDVLLNLEGSREGIFTERSGSLSSQCFVLSIRPLYVMKNCLPVTLHYTLGEGETSDKTVVGCIEPGSSSHLLGFQLRSCRLTLKIMGFCATDWLCDQHIDVNMPELSSWCFLPTHSDCTHPSKLELAVNVTVSRGTNVLSIYAPFWMVNKTAKLLAYRAKQDRQNVLLHPAELDAVPMMFSYPEKSMLGKRKASVRIEDSSWSDPFTLDTIEDTGKVSCKKANPLSKKDVLHLGVHISMSKCRLTKIIIFTPFYMIHNDTANTIVIWEMESEDVSQSGLEIPPGSTCPFWPSYGADNLVAQIKSTRSTTPSFSLNNAYSTLLMLGNRFGGLHIECKTSTSETLLIISSYKKGLAPVQLINHCRAFSIEYSEKDNGDTMQTLLPGETCYFTWLRPAGSRVFVWSVSGHDGGVYTNTLLSDEQDVVQVSPDRYISWVSFLDGMQRVLMFSEDANLCYGLAHSIGENERIEQEIDISIYGIGISLVNNTCYWEQDRGPNYEIAYMSICSSDIVWETRRAGKTRYKPLTQSQCQLIEADYRIYCREKSIGKRIPDHRIIDVPGSKHPIEVNYEESKMKYPHQGRIRRQFQKGLWLNMRSSAHQRQIHAQINRIQIDNQMFNCLFPVMLAPVPLPRSVVADSIPKPFMELSVLEYKSPERCNLRQFKYVHALVQELHIKADQGLINALIDFVGEQQILDESTKEGLAEDLRVASQSLAELANLRAATEGQKDFFDDLHLSPLKVHLSFSLTSYQSSSQVNAASNFFALFLQSLGVTIIDIDDVIFRLAYFERKHSFCSFNDLVNQMTTHYASQAIKQIYVIIFGLDVIGNPFGLVVGVSRSVEDLFYEPFQGAVEGPSEFAEGLVIGVRSVFSGVVGGAAGTVSRITGAIGKGLASLTFDEKFQSKRREAIKKRGRQNFGESLARGSKGLVMGIVDGVAGVAIKPIEGAREEGLGGFLKGVGKGVVGLVARPTGGIIDFASGTFDSVKRATEVTEEVNRVRLPRFLHPDGVVRYFNAKEATGNCYLKSLNKGRYAESDLYVAHEMVDCDGRSVLLVSSKRILFIVYSTVLGSWSIEWEFAFPDITGPPPIGNEASSSSSSSSSVRWFIVIKPKEDRSRIFGLFGGSEPGKKVFLMSQDAVQNMARIIEEHRLRHSSSCA